MKVDRRSFLGLGIGAVAGIAVSPVGMKLTDDISILTQTTKLWPWALDHPPLDGKITYENSVCSLCPGSCGISIRKIDQRPVKIEGLADYPVNDGGACLHGMSGLQYLYDPARIKAPMKKKGDSFEEISWEEAISEVAAKLNDLRDTGAAEKLACITDKEQGSVSGLLQQLLKAYGSPNFYTMPTLESYLEIVARQMHGKGKTLGFDLDNSDFVLSFGAGIIDGWGSPVACFKANATRKERDAKLYQIEPRLSNTAANATKWIPAIPGTEADLALALCSVILKENLFDSTATTNFKGGFNRFVAMVQKEYSASKIAKVTGIKEEDIVKTARAFAAAKMPVAVFGKGKGDGAQSLKEMAAVHALNCLVGNVNKKGGVFVKETASYLEFPQVKMDTIAGRGPNKAKAGKYVEQMLDSVNASTKPVIEALVVYNANPCYSLRDTKKVKQAMSKIPFVVSISSYLDETAMEADIILPCHTFVERLEDVPSSSGLSQTVVGLSRPMVKPIFDTKNAGDVILEIGKALDERVAANFEWDSYEECLETLTSSIWDSLSDDGYAVLSEGAPSGSEMVDFSYLADNPATVQAQGDFNLTLISVDNMRLLSGAVAASPFAVKTVADTVLKNKDIVVEIHPMTAKGLKDKGMATLTTPLESVKVRVHFNEGIRPGVIGMVEGLGHTFDNKYVSKKGVNVNMLIGQVLEPGTGLDAAFGIKAKISRA